MYNSSDLYSISKSQLAGLLPLNPHISSAWQVETLDPTPPDLARDSRAFLGSQLLHDARLNSSFGSFGGLES